MGEFMSPALRQPPPSDTERQRIRELSKYYCTINRLPPPPAIPHPSPQDDAPTLSPDITLNALTQLAVYRFACDRSFVSLIDEQNQYIIAETTASISLRNKENHRPNHGIYLGVSTLDLVFGVCPDAVKLFTGQPTPALHNSINMTADKTRFIVRDFSVEEHYKDRPYVKQWPHFRFYAEVPIYSTSGYVLGSFCIVDNKPRQEFGDKDVAALQEISDSISQHLENVRIVHYHQRSDRLVQGLTTFVKGHSDHGLFVTDSKCEGSSSASISDLLSHRQSRVDETSTKELSSPSDLIEGSSPSFSGPMPSECTDMTSISSRSTESILKPLATSPSAETKPSVPLKSQAQAEEDVHIAAAPAVEVKKSVTPSKSLASIFSSASTLLRESMDLDGVLFLDASRCNSGIVHSDKSIEWEPSPKAAGVGLQDHSLSHLPNLPSRETSCDALGFALRTSQAGNVGDTQKYEIEESLLQELVAVFPNGQIIDLEEASTWTDHNVLRPRQEEGPRKQPSRIARESLLHDGKLSRKAVARLLHHFSNVRSLIFLPLWDWDKAQWLAGTFLWTQDRERTLGLEELHYFKVFGDSIISEVARVSWSTQEQAKSAFISSLSHELRSPLHGILGSAELLSGTPLEADQRGMVKMLETCGLTLLDTMNHLLDFTKINNLSRRDRNSDSDEGSIANLESTFELDALLDDVVSTMYLGNRHAAEPSQSMDTSGGQGDERVTSGEDRLSVVLRIGLENDWKVQSSTGAWRRIIMNVLGNALKFTKAGFIEVSLSKVSKPSRPGQLFAHLSVTDSGRGMSSEFLRNKLFDRFAQEDYLSEGVGLGLSVVRQLVTLLDGSINVRSELGVGTQVDIFIPVQPQAALARELDVAASDENTRPTKFCLIGFQAYSDLSEAPTGTLSGEAKRRLCIQSFFTDLVSSQPGWSVSFAETLEHASGDVAIIEEPALNQPNNELLDLVADTKFNTFVLLGEAVSTATVTGLASRAHIYRMPQPFCPRKGLDILKRISQSNVRSRRQLADSASPPMAVSAIDKHSHTFIIPVPSVAHKKTAESFNDNRLSQKSYTSMSGGSLLHVLIVDDNTINVKIISAFMGKLGWTFDTASNGLIALEKYKESPIPFKAVLMDISMPVMDGITATKHIRAFEQEKLLPPVRILAVTGVASTTTRQQAVSAGVDDYLIKPLSLQQLKYVMEDAQHCG